MEQSVKQEERLTFTDQLRAIFRDPLQKIGLFLHKLGVKPNYITFTGLAVTAIGALLIAVGRLSWGGAVIMAAAAVDALDGAVARAKGEPEAFGAFVDSVSDRYGELMIYGSLLWYFVSLDNFSAAVVTFVAAAGSVLVSYIRARAQSLGYEAKVGILTRVERILVIGPATLFHIPFIGVALVAALANITAFQRIAYVRRQAKPRKDKQ